MKRYTSIKSYFIPFLICYVLITPHQAHAYLDPGTGSLIIQVIIASMLGVSFAVKHFWHNLKRFVLRIFLKNKEKHDRKEITK